jgi:choice-of-anchor B domain-containing protein
VFTWFPATSQKVASNVELLGQWYDSNVPFDGLHNTYNEVWGFAWKGHEYAVIGARKGTYLIDVTEKEYPGLVAFIPGAADDVTNRDYHDLNGYLYMVADQGESTLQIVDYRALPDTVHLVYNSDSLFARCHNIFIDSVSQRLYACSVKKDTLSYDLQIYALSDPVSPELLLSYDAPSAFHDIYVKNDTAFGNNEREGLFVYDFTDLNDPKVLGALIDYPEKGYNHSGWTTPDGKYYFFADETPGSDIKVCAISDLENIEVLGTFNSGEHENAMAHNPIVKGNKLYIAYYHDGLQIFDIQQPASPVKVGFYDTYLGSDYTGGKGAWGVYPFLPSGTILVSDREKGLFILDDSKAILPKVEPAEPIFMSVYPNPFTTQLQVWRFSDQTIHAMELFDVTGVLVKSIKPNSSANPVIWNGMETVLPGTYLLKIHSAGITSCHKVVKSF